MKRTLLLAAAVGLSALANAQAPAKPDPAKAKEIVNQICAACHGPTGAGIPRNYPRLSGQWSDYTLAQLKAFKSGERGLDKGGKDVNGQIMVGVARGMSEAQMKALADYAQGLR